MWILVFTECHQHIRSALLLMTVIIWSPCYHRTEMFAGWCDCLGKRGFSARALGLPLGLAQYCITRRQILSLYQRTLHIQRALISIVLKLV